MTVFTEIELKGINAGGKEETFKLSGFKGKKIVLYFYPKDSTSGCTKEACQFRDNYSRLLKKAVVVGVSPDSIKSHLNFQKAQNLNFILLSDPDHILSKSFNVWRKKNTAQTKSYGIERSTFIINENGKIEKEWRNVEIEGHVDIVLKALAEKNKTD